MAEKSSIYKPRPVTGFPEWLPEVRLVEQRWLDTIRAVFESYGFCSVETPSVEEIAILEAKGEDVDKEIYALNRLQGDASPEESRVALHYDLTVPLARYVAQHYQDLVFPFKRYQIQKAWRGERPQEGRFREFLQCDIDVIDNDTLALSFDAEMPAIAHEILSRLAIGAFTLRLNNRKILAGFYEGLGIEDTTPVLRIADKLDKIGAQGVVRTLEEQLGLSSGLASKCLRIAEIQTTDTGFEAQVRALGVRHAHLDEGLGELAFVMDALGDLPPGSIVADMSIARGFDYYTGTVYEGKWADYPEYPSICSGGRYDDLASAYIRKRLPGIGISIGLTRIFAKMVRHGRLQLGAKTPTEVLVAFVKGAERAQVAATAARLRRRGFKVEMYHEPRKLEAQLRYANRKGIAHVWFPGTEGMAHEVKTLATGTQCAADPETWQPDAPPA
jgi:histidyl-tRNA synthetase